MYLCIKMNRLQAKLDHTPKCFNFQIVIILMIRRIEQLDQSLLSSSVHINRDRHLFNHEGEPDIRRLKRKIIVELPEQKVAKSTAVSTGMFCGKVFDPTSNLILGWYVITIFLIYLYFIQIPIAVAFDQPRSQNQHFFYFLNFAVIFLFLVDIVINLNTGFYEDGELQTDPTRIKIHYLKNNIAFDMLSLGAIFAFELGYLSENIDPQDQYLRYVYLIFFLRLKKVAKLEKAVLLTYDLHRRAKATFKLILLLVKILFVCNLVACGGFMLSKYLATGGVQIKNKDGSICCDCYWVNATKQGDRNLLESQFYVQYIYSLYWASTTMISIGYGDITPKNSYEVTFTVIIQFLSCLLYAYAINQIWNNMLELNRKKTRINARLNTINLYMRDKGIGPQLNSKVNGYLTNYYYAKNLRERDVENEIMGELTPALKKQLFYESYSVLFEHKYFASIIEKVIVLACQNVKQVCCYQDQSLSSRDFSPSPCLYFLKKGELNRQYGSSRKIIIKTQYRGDYIGLFQFITQLSYLSELTAIQYTLVYYIKYDYWRIALLEDRGCFQYFYLTKQSLMLYNQFTRIGQMCHFCSLQNHRTQLCFHYKLAKQIKKSYQTFRKSEDQHRKHFTRRKFTIKIGQKKVRKKSFCKHNNDFHPLRELHHHASLLQIDMPDNPKILKKWSLNEDADVRRGGKFFVKPRQKHQTHMLDTIRELYANKSQSSQDQSLVNEQIKWREINIDALAHYEEYYPRFNCSQLNPKQVMRRRITRSFYF